MDMYGLSFELSTARGKPAMLQVAGEIDLGTADQLRDRLVAPTAGERPQLVVDLTGVSFYDASGLSAFLAGREEAHKRGGWLRLCSLQPVVAKLFRITVLDQVFAIYPTSAEAAAGHIQPRPDPWWHAGANRPLLARV